MEGNTPSGRRRPNVVSTTVKSIGSTSIIGADGAGVDAVRPDSGTGLEAGGRVVARDSLDPLADPEGPTGIEGEPADGDPVGLPLGSVGPEGAPEGGRAPKDVI